MAEVPGLVHQRFPAGRLKKWNINIDQVHVGATISREGAIRLRDDYLARRDAAIAAEEERGEADVGRADFRSSRWTVTINGQTFGHFPCRTAADRARLRMLDTYRIKFGRGTPGLQYRHGWWFVESSRNTRGWRNHAHAVNESEKLHGHAARSEVSADRWHAQKPGSRTDTAPSRTSLHDDLECSRRSGFIAKHRGRFLGFFASREQAQKAVFESRPRSLDQHAAAARFSADLGGASSSDGRSGGGVKRLSSPCTVPDQHGEQLRGPLPKTARVCSGSSRRQSELALIPWLVQRAHERLLPGQEGLPPYVNVHRAPTGTAVYRVDYHTRNLGDHSSIDGARLCLERHLNATGLMLVRFVLNIRLQDAVCKFRVGDSVFETNSTEEAVLMIAQAAGVRRDSRPLDGWRVITQSASERFERRHISLPLDSPPLLPSVTAESLALR